MRIWDFLSGNRKKQVNTDQAGPVGFRVWSSGIKTDPIFSIYDNCGINYQPKTQHETLSIARTAYETLPFVRRAVKDISAMVGNGRIVAAEGQTLPESALKELNDIAAGLPLLSEFDWIRPHETGLDSLIYRAVRTALKDGGFYGEDRFDEFGNYLGHLIFDTGNFEFVYEGLGPYRLRYKGIQYPDLETGFFHTWGYEFANEQPWPNPLIAGGSFFLHILTAVLVAVRNQSLRKAAPLEVLAVSVKNDVRLQDQNTRTSYTNAIDSLQESLKKGIESQQRGKGTSILSRVPMDIDLLSRTFGAEAANEIDPEILSLVLMGFANLLEIPFEFLGQVLGGTGFSKERFSLLFKIWGGKVDNIRTSIRPVVLDVLKNYLRFSGVSPVLIDRIDVEFVLPDVMDAKEQAEIGNIQAEANVKHTEVAAYLSQIDTEAAVNYLEKYGLLTI